MEELIDKLRNLASRFNQEQEDQTIALCNGDEELDRGHSEDCYLSGIDDGENSVYGEIKDLLEEHLSETTDE